jgi:hypothetical protein
MAAVEFPVEAPGSGIGDGAWLWASGRSRFPRGLPPAHCAMAVLSEDRRSSVSGQPWRVILVLGSLPLPQKSTLCFQTEDRVRIFPAVAMLHGSNVRRSAKFR